MIAAVAAGERDIAVTNSYYLAPPDALGKPEDKAVVEKVTVVFPNQQSWARITNIAGGAVARHTKHQANAISSSWNTWSPEAQNYFANGTSGSVSHGRGPWQPCPQGHDRRQAVQERDYPHQRRGCQ